MFSCIAILVTDKTTQCKIVTLLIHNWSFNLKAIPLFVLFLTVYELDCTGCPKSSETIYILKRFGYKYYLLYPHFKLFNIKIIYEYTKVFFYGCEGEGNAPLPIFLKGGCRTNKMWLISTPYLVTYNRIYHWELLVFRKIMTLRKCL